MTKLKLENIVDSGKAAQGLLHLDAVRRFEVEALVDTGATTLVIPADIAEALGLRVLAHRRVKLASGAIEMAPLVTHLFIEILGRQMACDALVMPAGSTPLIGQIPLEALDLIVDAKSRDLAVNPASPDTPLLDCLLAS